MPYAQRSRLFQNKVWHRRRCSKCCVLKQVFGPFAAVVIATPLELTNIQFKGIDLPHLPPRKFQSTISTFVTGSLNGSYFGLNQAPEGTLPFATPLLLMIMLVLLSQAPSMGPTLASTKRQRVCSLLQHILLIQAYCYLCDRLSQWVLLWSQQSTRKYSFS